MNMMKLLKMKEKETMLNYKIILLKKLKNE